MLTTPKPLLWGYLAHGGLHNNLPAFCISAHALQETELLVNFVFSFPGHAHLGMSKASEMSSESFVPRLPPERELEKGSSAFHVALNQCN